jgi:hypothetical protein
MAIQLSAVPTGLGIEALISLALVPGYFNRPLRDEIRCGIGRHRASPKLRGQDGSPGKPHRTLPYALLSNRRGILSSAQFSLYS